MARQSLRVIVMLAWLCCVPAVSDVVAADLLKWPITGRLPPSDIMRVTTLAGAYVAGTVPDYQWWYGCSPTAAGMLIGYYDINGYRDATYSRLLPNAIAEPSTFPSVDGTWNYAVQHAIASPRHVSDFYPGGYLASGDDVPGAPTGLLDSLADFMGTSQDLYGNVNGGTTLWFYTDGSRLSVADLFNAGDAYLLGSSGTYGIYEFLRRAGYADANPQAVTYLYNQLLDTLQLPNGFTFADYRSEIDAGRVVLIHLENHSMLGYGYDAVTGEVVVHDTANAGGNRVTWGGSYYGYRMIGVTVVDFSRIAGDEIEPPAPPASTSAIVPIIDLLLLE
jgi:hypothetical protein